MRSERWRNGLKMMPTTATLGLTKAMSQRLPNRLLGTHTAHNHLAKAAAARAADAASVGDVVGAAGAAEKAAAGNHPVRRRRSDVGQRTVFAEAGYFNSLNTWS